METWVNRETMYRGRIFRVDAGTARLDDGLEVKRDVIVHPGAVAVVPVIGDGVALVRQYRIAIEREMLEIPAGRLEPGDTPEGRARIELAEEAGFAAGRLAPAGRIYPSVGILSECIHLFLAFDLAPETREADADERIEVVHVPIGEVRRRLREHAFEDAKTVAGLYALLAHLDAR
jgi:ADP-ribose pyrophosphatase